MLSHQQSKGFTIMARRLIHTAIHTTQAGTVHAAKVYRDSEWNEWQVEFKGSPKATYHTDDKADAIGTADYHISRIAKQFA
jgi:hypothetical protein